MNEPETPASDAVERRAEARRWLSIVEDDIDVALAVIELPRPRAGVAAYHLQQAAEKLFKAMLVSAGLPFRRTHDLDDLADQIAPLHPEWSAQLDALRPLTVWGVAYRYPGIEDEPEPEPTVEELRDAARLIGEILRGVKES